MNSKRIFVVAVAIAAACGGGDGTEGPVNKEELLPCDVAQMLSDNCTACHGTTLKEGAPMKLLSRTDLLAEAPLGGTVLQRSLARMRQSEAPMPPQYSGLHPSEADIELLEAWSSDGKPTGGCYAIDNPLPGGTGGCLSR